jgi:hypothetical protein
MKRRVEISRILILKDLSTRCVGVCPKIGKKGLTRSMFVVDTTEGFSYGYTFACGKTDV